MEGESSLNKNYPKVIITYNTSGLSGCGQFINFFLNKWEYVAYESQNGGKHSKFNCTTHVKPLSGSSRELWD